MTSMDRLPESSPERIDIAQLAQELGVDEMYYTYPAWDLEKSRATFEYFQQNVHNDDGRVSVESEATIHLSELFSGIDNIPYLPLFFGKIQDVPFWQKSLFIDIWVAYIVCRSIQLRTKLLQDLKDRDTLLSDVVDSIARINDLEIFNTFGSIFDKRVESLLAQQPVFHNLKRQIFPLEEWYDEQLNVARQKKAPDLFLKKADKDFWLRNDLPVAKLFILNPATHKMDPREFIVYIDRFLCHAESEYFDLIAGGIKSEKSVYLPRWKAWIYARKQLLFEDNENETQKVFAKIFGIQGRILENWELSEQARSKLPELLSWAFDQIVAVQKKAQKKLKKTVSHIPVPVQSNTAISALLSRPAQPTKIIVPSLDIKTILPDFETSKSVNKQLTQIDFSGCDFPEWTVVTVERALPSKKKDVLEVIEGIDPRGKNTIEPVLGRGIQGQFAYKITIVLPSTHRFEGGNVFKVSYYAKAEPTPAEIEAERVQREVLKNQPKILPETVTTLVVAVEEKVESTIDPVANSLIAASFVLAEKQEQYAIQDSYRGGPIHITLTDADCVEVLGDESAALLSEHKHWTVNEDDSINPSVQDADVLVVLRTITEKIRENYRLKQEQEQKETREKQEIAEYESQRKNFEPLLEFARNFKFEWKENGNFEDQKTILREELKKLGWSIPVAWAGNQVVWRHMQSNIRILYTSKICTGYEIQTETKGTLTPALKKCYEEVAEAFAHIARFFNAETRERKKMITREQTMRKEVENSAVSYDALLAKGQARLVLFSPYQKSYGAWSSKFPTEKTPHMLDERASHGTVESLLQQYSHAELCYRRDLLCINGEIAEDASQESIENTSLNITELRHSPRARYILKKRILITLKLEKFPDETDRAPIKHEKNKREGKISALDILLRMKNEKAVQTSSDITDDFISWYIDELEKNRIRVHYVWPLSSRLDEHRARIKKHAAKKSNNWSD